MMNQILASALSFWLWHCARPSDTVASHVTTSPVQGCCPGLPMSIRQSLTYLSAACADSARLTQWRVLFDARTTPSANSALQQLDQTCGTRCATNYNNSTLSESSNGCWRHTCDIFS